jgi:vacuolar-type H+-ATPase subunit F/Vma7
MSHPVRVLCRPEVAAGFGLAGLRAVSAATAAEGEARLRELLRDPDAGVVLVEDGLYEALAADTRRQLGRRPLPMVVPFPGPTWAERAAGPEAYILELLRQVIGYRVKLR